MIITGRFSVAVLLATLLSAATTRAQYDVHWLYSASGNWNAASNWSTYPSWPNGTPYHVTIDAAGILIP